MQVSERPIADLIPFVNNARTHSDSQVSEIAASIKEFGFNNPVLVDGANGIIAGHGRLLAARKLGMSAVPCIELSHLTDLQKRAYILADNRLAEKAGWDFDLVSLELESLLADDFDIELTGFDDEFLIPEETEGLTDPDDVPEPPDEPITQPGDVWILGNHRLMCGDSTSIDAVEKLMDGQKADMVFTDPPYNVDYEGKTKDTLTIKNDSMSADDFVDMLSQAFLNINTTMQDGAPIYVTCPLEDGAFHAAFIASGLKLQSVLMWLKNSLVMGRKDYHYKHEPILYGWKEGAAHFWQGGRDKVSVIECNRPSKSSTHPTSKPVELIEILFGNSCRYDAIVSDLFGGSGSTLIACEKTNRNCRIMELDPKYCDVIITRWQDFTGKQAVHENGTVFETRKES